MNYVQSLLQSKISPKRLRIHQSPMTVSTNKSMTNNSTTSIRIRTQQSISPNSKLNKTGQEPYFQQMLTVIFSFDNANHTILIPIKETTDKLLQRCKEINSSITSLISINKDLAVDYYLTSNRQLTIFRDQILSVTGYVGNVTKNKVSLKDFILIKCIGIGGFSRVYLVKKKSNGKFYAMKLVDKALIKQRQIANIIENERNIMAVTSHPFLNKLEYAFECPNHLIFVTEYCSGGELLVYLQKVTYFSEQQAKFYFVELALALLYLHQLDIVYRDIKPENILIDHQGHIRLADFGLSKPNMKTETYSFCGSPEYMAPEMLMNQGHSLQLDHYCLGVLLYELVTGLPPFYSKNIEQIYDAVLNSDLQFPKQLKLSPQIKDLITKLMARDVTQRLGYRGGLLEILDHPWFLDVELLNYQSKKVTPPFLPEPLKISRPSKKCQEGELDMLRKLMDKETKDVMFKNFYYDESFQLDVKLEQQKFYRFYLQLIEQQQGKINKRRKQKLLQSMKSY